MKKRYKLIECYDESEEADNLSEILEDFDGEGVWLDTGEITVLLPPEIAKCLDADGILGIA